MRCPSISCRAGLGPRVALGLGLLLAGCSRAPEVRHGPTPAIARAQVAPTTDVPALLGASIDGLRQRLGAPVPLPASLRSSAATTVLAGAVGASDSVATFRTGGLLLLASYDARSRRVRDLVLLGHHEDSLMGRARLRTNAASYLVMPVFYTGHAFRLFGLRVIATN